MLSVNNAAAVCNTSQGQTVVIDRLGGQQQLKHPSMHACVVDTAGFEAVSDSMSNSNSGISHLTPAALRSQHDRWTQCCSGYNGFQSSHPHSTHLQVKPKPDPNSKLNPCQNLSTNRNPNPCDGRDLVLSWLAAAMTEQFSNHYWTYRQTDEDNDTMSSIINTTVLPSTDTGQSSD